MSQADKLACQFGKCRDNERNPQSTFLSFVSNVDSLDWKDYGVDSIIKTVTEHKHLGNGSIILCHNGAKYTADALDTLITTLEKKDIRSYRSRS